MVSRVFLFPGVKPTLVLLIGAMLWGCSENSEPLKVSGIDVTQSGGLIVDETRITAQRSDEALNIFFPITTHRAGLHQGTVEIALRHLDGTFYQSEAVDFELSGNEQLVSLTFEALPAEIKTGDLTNYVIHYVVESGNTTLKGRRSLFSATQKRDIRLIGSDTFVEGAESHLRLIATEPVSGEPLDAEVRVFVNHEEESTLVFSGSTDELGLLSAPVTIPEDFPASHAELEVRVDSELGQEIISEPIQISREQRIMITTDKPIYQPGQVIHLRTLTLRRPSLLPEANKELLMEIADGKGNKIFKETITTDVFGVAAVQFPLARELNMGRFSITATMDETVSEKDVTVERYALPKFNTVFSSNRSYYRPGERLRGNLGVNYFFGKPVSGGTVRITAYKFDVEFVEFSTITGFTDDEGNFDFEMILPTYFVGLPLEQGNAFVRIDISVTDLADHTQELSKTVSIAQNSIISLVIPQSTIIPGHDAHFFILTSDPNGAPAITRNQIFGEGIDVQCDSDDQGVSEFSITVPEEATGLNFNLISSDLSGVTVESPQFFDFANTQDTGAISLMSDRALYEVGDTVSLAVITSGTVDRVYLDVIRENQTMLTTTVDVEDGIADYDLDLGPDISGSLQLNAYYVSHTGDIIRGHKLIYVDPANDLAINIDMDKSEYLPGDTATAEFQILDAGGDGVASSIGLQIVDEAVFALVEFQPGLEKIYFQLEQEILKPRYEIHGYELLDIMGNGPEEEDAERERKAEILFAASQDVNPYKISVNTLKDSQIAAQQIVEAKVLKDSDQILRHLQNMYDLGSLNDDNMPYWIEHLNGRFIDPWGQPYLLVNNLNQNGFNVNCTGPDEITDTDDDVQINYNYLQTKVMGGDGGQNRGDCCDDDGFMNNDWDGDFAEPGVAMEDEVTGAGPPSDSNSDGTSESAQPRVRRWFPETLYTNPSVITDDSGFASITFQIADSITTWRMTSIASSRDGRLGSTLAGIRVFQDFFIDIDFPATLTQNDEISVPVAIYNYLEGPQTVNLVVQNPDSDDWYVLLSPSEVSLDLEPGEITVRYFRVKVLKVGWHSFQLTAFGDQMSDAISRRIEVLPDGKEFVLSESDRLEGDIDTVITIPEESIEGGSAIVVKIYPGLFSQMVEGLDSMLRMPSGCFEQTSSTTYPNVLVMNYMIETDQITPEIEMTAKEYINLGYQRLLSFEVNGGGFEWFGNDPAHRILTAYGLLEFFDMAKVHNVDEAVITRTQAWLASEHESDGRFKAAKEGIHEGATNSFQDSDVRATAYILYSLIWTGYSGVEVDNGINWLKTHYTEVSDNYSLALVANALLAYDPNDDDAQQVLRQLDEQKTVEEGENSSAIFWTSNSQGMYYSGGDAMNMETTAWVLLAMIQTGSYQELVAGGVNYLVRNKDAFGNWSSTQATILSLRVFMEMLLNSTSPAAANIKVFYDDILIEMFDVDESNSDVMRMVDLKLYTEPGPNQVRIEFDGEGELLYQITGKYFLPWEGEEIVERGPIDIDVSYDRTELTTDDLLTATVTLNNTTDARQDMILVDLGIPPGFDIIQADLQAYVNSRLFSKVETTGRQIIVYLYGLDPQETVSFSYGMLARMPMEAQTPSSQVYLYYDSDQRSDSEPIELHVN